MRHSTRVRSDGLAPLIVFVADAGPAAGLGHLSRCSSLAIALQVRGATTATYGVGLRADATRCGVTWEPVSRLDAGGASAIVIDSYGAADPLRAELAAVAPIVEFNDDPARKSDAALVIALEAGSARLNELAGFKWACLGPTFWWCRPSTPREVRRILVTTGGGDSGDLGSPLARGLGEAFEAAQVILVRGPYAPPADLGPGVTLVESPDDLFGTLNAADLVVSAGGQTMLEALAVGTPCVAMITADNQVPSARRLEAIGAVTVAESTPGAIAAAQCLAGDPGRMLDQIEAGRQAIDGRGALRVAAAVLNLVPPARGTWTCDLDPTLGLRPATPEDEDFLLHLRDDPGTRGFSFTSHIVSRSEHRAWLAARLTDADSQIWIATVGRLPIGQVRLSRVNQGAAEVHIAIRPEFRGCGHSREMLDRVAVLGRAEWPDVTRLRARVMQGNERSLRAFHAAGFAEVQEAGGARGRLLERDVSNGG